MVQDGNVGVSGGVGGAMVVGDFLRVKWKDKDTGEVFEDDVDLRKRLPREMENREICFYIVGPQLYVYVVEPGFLPVGSPEEVPPGAPIKRLPGTYHKRYRIIYPDQARSN
jgi:hypothetical protein